MTGPGWRVPLARQAHSVPPVTMATESIDFRKPYEKPTRLHQLQGGGEENQQPDNKQKYLHRVSTIPTRFRDAFCWRGFSAHLEQSVTMATTAKQPTQMPTHTHTHTHTHTYIYIYTTHILINSNIYRCVHVEIHVQQMTNYELLH